MGKEGESDPSIIREMDGPDGNVEIREQSEGGELTEGRLEIKARCQTLSKPFKIEFPEISEKGRPDVCDDKKRISSVDLAY